MTVFLMDPYLKDYSGHCYNYLHTLSEELKELSIETVLVGNEICKKELINLNVKPLFSNAVFKPTKHKFRRDFFKFIKGIFNKKNERAEVLDFMLDLENVINSLDIKADDIVFINSLRPGQLLGFSYWLKNKEYIGLPKFKIVLHFTSKLKNYSGYVFSRQYRTAFIELDSVIQSGILELFADTQELIDEFYNLNATIVKLAPIPTLKKDTEYLNEHFLEQRDNQGKPIVISFLGEARKDKGFHLLLETGKYLEKLIKSGQVVFKVQCGRHGNKKKTYQSLISGLRASGAEIIDEEMSIERYFNLILASDIILLPYTGYSYRTQSSGVFAEALANGKIVIVSPETWMANQLKMLDIYPLSEKLNQKKLKHSVKKCLDNFEFYKKNFSNIRKQWNKKNDLKEFSRNII